MCLLEDLIKRASLHKGFCWLVDILIIHNMIEVSRYIGVGHGSDTKATNKILNDGDSFFYSDYWDKSYTIIQ